MRCHCRLFLFVSIFMMIKNHNSNNKRPSFHRFRHHHFGAEPWSCQNLSTENDYLKERNEKKKETEPTIWPFIKWICTSKERTVAFVFLFRKSNEYRNKAFSALHTIWLYTECTLLRNMKKCVVCTEHTI